MANNINKQEVAENNNNVQDRRFLKEHLRVCVHGGVFHADDVCAIALINLFRREKGLSAAEVIRSRDPKVWDTCDILVDVGEGEYDHHGTSYSIGQWADAPEIPSCGFSKVLEAISNLQGHDDYTWFHVLENTAKAVACFDNGKPELLPEGIYSPFCWVHEMNTPWNYKHDQGLAAEDEQKFRFLQAVYTSENILSSLIEAGYAALDAEEEHEFILAARPAADFYAIQIPAGLPNWQATVCKHEDCNFVYYQGLDKTWYIWCVPPDVENIFKQRQPLPEAWSALRDAELGAKILKDIPDFNPENAIFCHKDRFCMGLKSREATRQILAYLATLHV